MEEAISKQKEAQTKASKKTSKPKISRPSVGPK
jgi:hypothetical protein